MCSNRPHHEAGPHGCWNIVRDLASRVSPAGLDPFGTQLGSSRELLHWLEQDLLAELELCGAREDQKLSQVMGRASVVASRPVSRCLLSFLCGNALEPGPTRFG